MTIETVTGETLAAFHAEKLGLNTEAPKVEVKAEEVKTDDAALQVEEGKEEPKEGEAPKPKSKLQNRFQELTSKVHDAEKRATDERTRAEAAERKAAELEAKLTPVKEEPKNTKPEKNDFKDAFDYAEALASWSAKDALAQRDTQEREAKEAKERQTLIDGWKARVEEARSRLPDWDDMIASSTVAVSDDVRDAIIESDHGPDILHLFASEPDVVESLNKLSPRAQLKQIGRLEAKFEKAEPVEEGNTLAAVAEQAKAVEKPRLRAPAPITPVKGTRSADNPLDDPGEFTGSFKEYEAARMAQQKRARG